MHYKATIAITGASGAIYGIKLIQALKKENYFIDLVISNAGKLSIVYETNFKVSEVQKLADKTHKVDNISASIASGSYLSDFTIITPCSMKTLAMIAYGIDDNLISRCASVTLKERRKLILITREAPLTLAHIDNMHKVTQMGGIIYPPAPAFYTKPSSIDDIADYTVARVLDLVNIHITNIPRWNHEHTET